MEERKQKLKTLALLGIVLTLLTIFSVTSFIAGRISTFGETSSVSIEQKITYAVTGKFDANIDFSELYALINQYRKDNNLNELRINPMLEKSAKAKSIDMGIKGYWSHYGPNGETPWGFIKDSGYVYTYAGENLARGYYSQKAIFDAWKISPLHNEVMLKPEVKEFGLAGGLFSGNNELLVVLHTGQSVGEANANCLATKCYREWQSYKDDIQKWSNKGIRNIQQQLDDWYAKYVK